VAGVKLNNNTATANTKRTKIQELKTCRIFAKNYENEEQISEKLAKLWLEWNSTTTQKARNRNTKNRDEKYADRLEMFVQMGTTLV